MKKIITICMVLLVIAGVILLFCLNNKNTNNAPKEIIEITTDDVSTSEVTEPTTEILEETKEEEKQVKDIVNNQNVEEKNKVVKKDNKKVDKIVETDNSSTPKQEETKPWEEYGISEYDYYHKPIWSWARVDYSLEKYGSESAAHQACIDDGNNLEDIISYSCTPLNNYAGEYIGDMLKIKK